MTLPFTLDRPGLIQIGRVPEGYDALLLAELARANRSAGRAAEHLHIARDDARLARLAETLAFFAPEIEIVAFPAWDCLPYDRVSPHRDIAAGRVEALIQLSRPRLDDRAKPRLVLTTVAAILQRLPKPESFAGATLTLAPGAKIDPTQLIVFLSAEGYQRVETVGEVGEFAVRGGIVDLFASSALPLRVDFFGDSVDQLRAFDPLTQRSLEKLDLFEIKPTGELRLEATAIERFRSSYRALFGAAAAEDPIYEAISAGQIYAGAEHWLPLFHSELTSLFGYLPAVPLTLDHQTDESVSARLEMIQDFYEARRSFDKAQEAGSAPYRPLPPERLYLDRATWERHLATRPCGAFSSFTLPGTGKTTPAGEGRPAQDFAPFRAQGQEKLYQAVRDFTAVEQAAGRRVIVAAMSRGSRERLGHLFKEHGLARLQLCEDFGSALATPAERIALLPLPLERGFGGPDFSVIAEADILGDRLIRTAQKRRKTDQFLAELANFSAGDLVVHVEHGIGRYEGLETLDVGGAPHDCLKLIYDGGDKLYIPVENIEVLSRFGSEDADTPLDRLGGVGWQSRKARVKQRILEIAQQLIRIAAQRQIEPGQAMTPQEGLYDEFAARFPYAETEDQLRAIEDVVADLGSGRPMDRLICGDVGFGKTEVALRAAFVAALSGYQVAIATPTTLLCRQHYRTFRDRFAGLPVRVGQLSRLTTAKETAEVKDGLKTGKIEIVVGTHALLAKSIEFANLGLMIVDEEQHFGVQQKERLKELRADVHVLTLTATPIPRTLQLALSGVREMSLIATPPVDRLAVRTFVLPYDPVVVREAILREKFRGGQIFYVAPRIEDLDKLAEGLRALVPEIRTVIAHGRLAPTQLEKAMTAFYERQYDLLLSTNIVESGLDIPTANTMIIHRADMFGLAQLYQLRGRIGRSKQRGYAYLTLPPGKLLSPTAAKRLQVMQTLDTLGAGFTLASHDLDIRGAGNLLGEEQSGHIREVGVELYQQMLEQAVQEAKGAKTTKAEWTPQISIGSAVLIPESYVADLGLRLGLYRRLSTLADKAELDGFAAELIDRFGPLPGEVENLLAVIAIKQLCRAANIDKIDAGPKGALLSFRGNQFANPAALIDLIGWRREEISLRPDHRLVWRQDWKEPAARIAGMQAILKQLAEMAGKAAS